MTERVGSIVVGAGVIGLAVARALALRGLAPLVLEGETHFGTWTSSRNSEVIHAGIYYPPGSLKAELCVAGKAQLYDFCKAHGVPHKVIGKLYFAHDETQRDELETIVQRAQEAGVNDLEPLDRAAVRKLEPELDCAAALLSPSTGIIDSHAFMLALLGEAEAHDAMLVTGSRIKQITRRAS
jgi:L-2-hydroxyglutarate oxidase LhgO